MTTIQSEIKKAKNKLIKRAQAGGLYENFGETELRKIADGFVNISSYSSQMNENRRKYDEFFNWCINFDLSQL